MDESLIDRIQDEFDRVVEDVQGYLTSESGVRLRQQAAAAMIAAAPVVAMAASKRMPLIGRLIGTAGVTAAVVKVAEKIRDWEPSGAGPATS